MSSDTNSNLLRYTVYVPYDIDADVYPFRVPEDADVDRLADLISRHRDLKHHLDDGPLRLFKCESLTVNRDLGEVHREALAWLRDHSSDQAMISMLPLTEYFPKGRALEGRKIDVIAVTKSMALSHVRSPSPTYGGLYPRADTVAAIWQKLRKYRFIWVRGTPASGKTCLANLLESHALKVVPSVNVIKFAMWPANRVASGDWRWFEYLKTRGWVPAVETVFIFDEAQMTYVDTELWIAFFKQIEAFENIYAIGFACYGSPLSHFDVGGTPIHIAAQQRITLKPIDHGDDCPPAGMLFTEQEFYEMMNRKAAATGAHHFDSSFLHHLFEITSGHIGAIRDIIKLVEAQDDFRERSRRGELFDWDTFQKNFPPMSLAKKLEGPFSTFIRGLPTNRDLTDVTISKTLSEVAQKSEILAAGVPDNFETLQLCVRRGWLHSDAVMNDTKIRYFFASYLHLWFVQWKLFLDNGLEDNVEENDIMEFVSKVFRRFNPKALSRPRTIGAGVVQSIPEAQYQDEFYRCSHAHCDGSVVAFPEFGTSRGRVDFYVKSKGWAIELLRNGDRLEQHVERFTQFGAYAGLNHTDYVVLDCRTTMPVKAHPHLAKLYHVVFQDEFRFATVLDHNLAVYEKFSLVNH